MDKTTFFTKMETEVSNLFNSKRSDGACFLIWFLINYFRLDIEEAEFHVCDKQNDKGIDGIFVDDDTHEIFIFQSKYSHNQNNTQGDKDIKNIIGASTWLQTKDNIEKIEESNACEELKSLVKRINLINKIESNYKTYCTFCTNKAFDRSANEFIDLPDTKLDGWDINRLFEEYIYTGHDEPVKENAFFSYDVNKSISGKINNKHDYYFIPVKVKEIVELSGIQDKTLFSRNVRYGLGNTRVNREIASTIRNRDEHKNVILYHNGITIIAEDITLNNNKINFKNYSIVNGCQSTVTFYQNRKHLSEELKVFVKLIKSSSSDKFGEDITYYTNNQNAISLRDLRSNDKTQQNLQEEFNKLYKDKIIKEKTLYKIKQGSDEAGFDLIIPNDFASQLITAFYLKEPYTTHQKTKIFDTNYSKIFNRNISASYLYILNKIYKSIGDNCDVIKHEGVRTYKTTKFFLLFVFRLIMEEDQLGIQILNDPVNFLASYQKNLSNKFSKLSRNIALDFNSIIEDEEKVDFFDYKNTLRNIEKNEKFSSQLVKDYKKQINKDPETSFEKFMQ